jgi:hypothetical protein
MAVFLYLTPDNPLLANLTDDASATKYIKITISRPAGVKTMLLPHHPSLSERTVVAITTSIYMDIDHSVRPAPSPFSLHSLLDYYEYYRTPEASEYALARHFNSADPYVAAASILYLTKNRSHFKMGTYLHHLRAAAAHHDCPFLFLANFVYKNNLPKERCIALLAYHFRQIASVKEAHRPYKPDYNVQPHYMCMKPIDNNTKFFTCHYCGTRLADNYATRLTHGTKCTAQQQAKSTANSGTNTL